MKSPFKNLGTPTPASTKGQTNKPSSTTEVNEAVGDTLPEKSPSLPWPAPAPPEGGKPMKFTK